MEKKVFTAKMFQQDGTIVAVIDGEVFNITPDSRSYAQLKQAFKDNDADTFYEIANKPIPTQQEVVKQVSDMDESINIEVNQFGAVTLNGEVLNNSVTDAIYRFAIEGLDYNPLVNFLKRLLANPSRRAVTELYGFLEACGLSITEDGCFLAYKTVRPDYLDKYTGTISNKPGESPKRLRRNQVDDNCNNTCSHGYHVGALAYAGPGGWYNSSGDKVIICKVDPADVVSVPTDHNGQKLRCCWYQVVSDYKGVLTKACYSGQVSDEDYDDDDEEERFTEEGEEIDSRDSLIGWEYEVTYYDSNDDLMTVRGILVYKNNYTIEIELEDCRSVVCIPHDNVDSMVEI